MIIPKKIIFLIFILSPFCVVAPHLAGFTVVTLIVLSAIFSIALYDGITVYKQSKKIRVDVDKNISLTLRKEGEIPLIISNPDKVKSNIALILDMPPALGSSNTLILRSAESEQFIVNWSCRPEKRGTFLLGNCYFELESPFKLWSWGKTFKINMKLTVYPNLSEDRMKLSALLFNNRLGIHEQPMVGQGREFEKLREYIPGDNYNIISWKATAKRGKPISKVFQIEKTQRVYAVIDNSRLSGRLVRNKTALEYYLNASLLLGNAVQKQGDHMGMIVFNKQVEKFIKASNGKSHNKLCLNAVTNIDTNPCSPDYSALFSHIKQNIKQRSLLVFFTDLSEEVITEPFLENISLLSRQHPCLVHMIQSPEVKPLFEGEEIYQNEDLYSRLAGHMCWTNLIKAKFNLNRHRVDLTIHDNENMTLQVIENYLSVKRRQLI